MSCQKWMSNSPDPEFFVTFASEVKQGPVNQWHHQWTLRHLSVKVTRSPFPVDMILLMQEILHQLDSLSHYL